MLGFIFQIYTNDIPKEFKTNKKPDFQLNKKQIPFKI